MQLSQEQLRCAILLHTNHHCGNHDIIAIISFFSDFIDNNNSKQYCARLVRVLLMFVNGDTWKAKDGKGDTVLSGML